MVKIGNVSLEKPALVLTIAGSESPRSLREAKRLGAQILELRIDRFRFRSEEEVIQKIRTFKKLRIPIIATIRSRKEGGGRSFPEADRGRLFRKILPWVDAIDLEMNSKHLLKLIPLAHQKGKRVILSYHNFHTTPPRRVLKNLLRKSLRRRADLVKIAVCPKKRKDVGQLLLFTFEHRKDSIISVAMGQLGRPSRILAPLFGSKLSYTFIGRSQAPGQIPIRQLGPEWKVFFSAKR